MIVLIVGLVMGGMLLIIHQADPSRGSSEFQPLVGRWARSDGGYVLEVRSAAADGRIDARYFNPRPINVAKAGAERQGDTLSLFIELRDVGYPGSTYALLYDAESDQLRGTYYQAATEQRFEVTFVREKGFRAEDTHPSPPR